MTDEDRALILAEIADCRAALRELRGLSATHDDILKPAKIAIRNRQLDAWHMIYSGDAETLSWSWHGFKDARAEHYDAIAEMLRAIAPVEREAARVRRQIKHLEAEEIALKHKLEVGEGRGAKAARRESTDGRVKRRKETLKRQMSLFGEEG